MKFKEYISVFIDFALDNVIALGRAASSNHSIIPAVTMIITATCGRWASWLSATNWNFHKSLQCQGQLVGIFIWYNWIGLALSSLSDHIVVYCPTGDDFVTIPGKYFWRFLDKMFFSHLPLTHQLHHSSCPSLLTEWLSELLYQLDRF